MGKIFKSIFSFVKKRWYIIVILVIGLIFFRYQRISSEKKEKEKNTYKVKRQTIKDELSLSGQIDAEEKITLRFQSSGKLSWVGVKEGDYVKKYQSIASLDQREVQQNLKKYLNTFVKERLDYDQEVEDTNIKYTGGLTEDARRAAIRVLDQAQYDLNNAVVDVELKKLAIEYSTIFSPIEGLVVRVGSPYAGVNITPSQAEIEIVNPKTVYFSATADQTDVIKLKQGLTGDIVLDSYPDENLKGKISLISFLPKEGETGTVYKVKLSLNDSDGDYKYRFGMTGDVSFLLKERRNVLTVPTSYIKTLKNKKYVWKLIDGKRVRTFVTADEEIDGTTLVKSGLQEGDVIW
ncbi:efflux RND transporter periplasmic adaptor subunit [Candidatus Roizmanbacteria bacterium]|nr:efflux RND transporter periplasmic adaptor subunit [Candidatus Roizmanbacteria bacterium]